MYSTHIHNLRRKYSNRVKYTSTHNLSDKNNAIQSIYCHVHRFYERNKYRQDRNSFSDPDPCPRPIGKPWGTNIYCKKLL
jgi:hypothetical protein